MGKENILDSYVRIMYIIYVVRRRILDEYETDLEFG